MNFDGVEKIAAAILYEGYILYPYRPTAIKNRQRWNFVTLYPRVYHCRRSSHREPYRLVAECLAVADAQASLDVRLRFLQLVRQQQSSSLLTAIHPWRGTESNGTHFGALRPSHQRPPCLPTLDHPQ